MLARGRYNLDLIVTAPSVVYKCELNNGDVVNVDAPGKLVDADERNEVQEPYVAMEIVRAQATRRPLRRSCVSCHLAPAQPVVYMRVCMLN